MRDWRLAVVAAAAVMLGLPQVWARSLEAGTVRLSGTIVSINTEAGTIVLGEVGPWRVKQGVTEITNRTVALTTSTAFSRVTRVTDSTTGFPGDFAEQAIGSGDLAPGEFITAECQREGERLTALKVIVTKLSGK